MAAEQHSIAGEAALAQLPPGMLTTHSHLKRNNRRMNATAAKIATSTVAQATQALSITSDAAGRVALMDVLEHKDVCDLELMAVVKHPRSRTALPGLRGGWISISFPERWKVIDGVLMKPAGRSSSGPKVAVTGADRKKRAISQIVGKTTAIKSGNTKTAKELGLLNGVSSAVRHSPLLTF